MIELLVVIAIIGLLASVAVPTVGKALDKGKLSAEMGKARTWKEIDLLIMQEDNTNLSSLPGTNQTDLHKWYAGIVGAVGKNEALKLFSLLGSKQQSGTQTQVPIRMLFSFTLALKMREM